MTAISHLLLCKKMLLYLRLAYFFNITSTGLTSPHLNCNARYYNNANIQYYHKGSRLYEAEKTLVD